MPVSRKWFTAETIHQPATTVDAQLITRQGVLYGWAFEETTGAATAQIELIDGSSSNGKSIVPITLLANESTRDVWGRPGLWCDNGVYLRIIAGSVRASIYYQALTEDEIIELLQYQVGQ